MAETIRKAQPDFKTDGLSDDYLKGMFSVVTSNAVAAETALSAVNAAADSATHADGGESLIDKARKANDAASREAYKQSTPVRK